MNVRGGGVLMAELRGPGRSLHGFPVFNALLMAAGIPPPCSWCL
ncbi:MAG: hypothetical protein ACLSUW_05835 [Akkermansia sp.]